jgi:O-succinylbenzoic acid--CoA ligase
MKEIHLRPVELVSPEWSIPQVAEALYRALSGSGPALAFAPISTQSVSEEIAVIIPTSGSTGQPKEVALTAAALISSARASHTFLGAQIGDRWSLLLPLNHIAGVNVLVRALELGVSVASRNEDAEFTAIVPTQLHRALHGDSELHAHLKNCTAVLVGGAETTDELKQAATDAGINIVTSYGMSEMSGGCVYNGTPLAGVSVKISEHGNIQLQGAMMASGYLNSPELWNATCIDGWFTTSDIGEFSDNHLTVLGRSDDQIISGGEKISLGTLEKFLAGAFPHQEFIAFGAPDLEWGTKLIIASNQNMDIEQLRTSVKKELGQHAVPKDFLTLPEIPRTSLGKLDRTSARNIYLAK